jgi:hypothetical protein
LSRRIFSGQRLLSLFLSAANPRPPATAASRPHSARRDPYFCAGYFLRQPVFLSVRDASRPGRRRHRQSICAGLAPQPTASARASASAAMNAPHRPAAQPVALPPQRPQVGIERLPARNVNSEPRESMNCKSCRKRKVSLTIGALPLLAVLAPLPYSISTVIINYCAQSFSSDVRCF